MLSLAVLADGPLVLEGLFLPPIVVYDCVQIRFFSLLLYMNVILVFIDCAGGLQPTLLHLFGLHISIHHNRRLVS